jgi:hypothetical protein
MPSSVNLYSCSVSMSTESGLSYGPESTCDRVSLIGSRRASSLTIPFRRKLSIIRCRIASKPPSAIAGSPSICIGRIELLLYDFAGLGAESCRDCSNGRIHSTIIILPNEDTIDVESSHAAKELSCNLADEDVGRGTGVPPHIASRAGWESFAAQGS